MPETVRTKTKPLTGTNIKPTEARRGLKYPFVTNIRNFHQLPPGLQVGLTLTEFGAELTMTGLACYETANITPTQQAVASEGPSTLNPKTLNSKTFNQEVEVSSGQIYPYLEGASQNFVSFLKTQLGTDAANIQSVEFMSTVKVNEAGQVQAFPYSLDYNDQLTDPDGKKTDFFSQNSLVTITNKNGESSLYLYSQLTDKDGNSATYGFVDKEDVRHELPVLNKVVTIPDEDNPKNALVVTIVDNIAFPILMIENAFNEQGEFVGGKFFGLNHSTGEKMDIVIDNLIGAVGVANVTTDSQGKIVSATGLFGDPSVSPPPTPEFIDVSFINNQQTNKPEVILTPSAVVPPAPTEAPVANIDKPTNFTDPEVAPTDTVIDIDVQGVRFAYGGEQNDILKYRYDESLKVWVEVTPVELLPLTLENFPKTHEDILALPSVTLQDGFDGRIIRFATENIDRVNNRIIPGSRVRTIYLGVNIESIGGDPALIPKDWNYKTDHLSIGGFLAKLVDENGIYQGGVVPVYIFKNEDNSYVTFYSVADEESLLNNKLLVDNAQMCFGLKPFNFNGENLVIFPVPSFEIIETTDMNGNKIRGDTLGSTMIVDIYERYGIKPLLDKFAQEFSTTELQPIPKSGSNIPMITFCASQN